MRPFDCFTDLNKFILIDLEIAAHIPLQIESEYSSLDPENVVPLSICTRLEAYMVEICEGAPFIFSVVLLIIC